MPQHAFPSPEEAFKHKVKVETNKHSREERLKAVNAIEPVVNFGLSYAPEFITECFPGSHTVFNVQGGFIRGTLKEHENLESKLLTEIWDVSKVMRLNFQNLDEFQIYCGPKALALLPAILKFNSDGTARATMSTHLGADSFEMVKKSV